METKNTNQEIWVYYKCLMCGEKVREDRLVSVENDTKKAKLHKCADYPLHDGSGRIQHYGYTERVGFLVIEK